MTLIEFLDTLFGNFDLSQQYVSADESVTYGFDIEDKVTLFATVNADEDLAVLTTALPGVDRTDTAFVQKLLQASCQGRGVGAGGICLDEVDHVALRTPMRFLTMSEARVTEGIARHLSYVAHWSEQAETAIPTTPQTSSAAVYDDIILTP